MSVHRKLADESESEGKILFDQYIEEVKVSIEEFRKYWEDNQKRSPEGYPDFMTPGNWDEQFISFLSYRT